MLRDRHEALILLREDELRRDRAHGRIARLSDHGCTRRRLRDGRGHGVRSGNDYGASGEHGEFSCNTAEE